MIQGYKDITRICTLYNDKKDTDGIIQGYRVYGYKDAVKESNSTAI